MKSCWKKIKEEKQFNTKIMNFDCELFLCENIVDETNKRIKFKTLSAVVFSI